ncbi:MAG: hypothetical protein JNL42_10795 [Anaerolineae bacterium]|nr:hypothetical protein [Anaerolineae bacterium]
MTTSSPKPLSYLEWIALKTLYEYRDRQSSPVKYVGLPLIIKALIERQPPLAAWVGRSADNQIHITDAGIAVFEPPDEA